MKHQKRLFLIFILTVLLLMAGLTVVPNSSADTEDNFPSSETAIKGNANGAAFPGSIQTSDDSFRNLNEANQAPNDINQKLYPVSDTSTYFNTWNTAVGCTQGSNHFECVNDDPDDGDTSYVETSTAS